VCAGNPIASIRVLEVVAVRKVLSSFCLFHSAFPFHAAFAFLAVQSAFFIPHSASAFPLHAAFGLFGHWTLAFRPFFVPWRLGGSICFLHSAFCLLHFPGGGRGGRTARCIRAYSL
jgi:hypothetical protein